MQNTVKVIDFRWEKFKRNILKIFINIKTYIINVLLRRYMKHKMQNAKKLRKRKN